MESGREGRIGDMDKKRVVMVLEEVWKRLEKYEEMEVKEGNYDMWSLRRGVLLMIEEVEGRLKVEGEKGP